MKCNSVKQSVTALIICILLALCAVCMGVYFGSAENSGRSDYFFGAAAGLAAVAAGLGIKTVVMLANPKYRKKQENSAGDERIADIRNRALAFTCLAMILITAGFGIFCAASGNMPAAAAASALVSAALIIFTTAYIFLSFRR